MVLFESICQFFIERNIQFRTVHHEPTFTSEESAKARGEEIKIGGKAILLKVDDSFKLFVLSAVLKVDSKKVKEYFQAKSIRFATKEELYLHTGLVPGSVPPFGNPFFRLNLIVDTSIIENEKIAFNAGSLTDSIVMDTNGYLSVCGGTVFNFAQEKILSF